MANNTAATSTIAGPDAQLKVKLKYNPVIDEMTPTLAAITSMVSSRSVHKKAVAAGVISIATTKMIPTVCKAETVTKVKTSINA